ncbi:MAG: DUF4175 domain-containing protein [Aestuariivita sp.]|nr:DUF4175 domain-containing protein [Aestuariivita sp.]
MMKQISLPLILTYLGLIVERLFQVFWPLISIILFFCAVLMLVSPNIVTPQIIWISGSIFGCAALFALVIGFKKLHWPNQSDALNRLDSSVSDRPIQTMMDQQALGTEDSDSVSVWLEHKRRMIVRLSSIKAVKPNLQISARDPFAVRYMALLAFTVAIFFGSNSSNQLPNIKQTIQTTSVTGPIWEAWAEPPRYTKLPTIYFNELKEETVTLPQGTQIILRFYTNTGTNLFEETVSGQPQENSTGADLAQSFMVNQSGELRINSSEELHWTIQMIEDTRPQITVLGPTSIGTLGRFSLPFDAQDDYGIEKGEAIISLNLDEVNRLHGLRINPEPRNPISVALPMPITGDRSDFIETLTEDFTRHPWANLPVKVQLSVSDIIKNKSDSDIYLTNLLARRFFDPLAAAIAEQRRDLLWSRANAVRVAQVLRALSNKPEDIFPKETIYLRLRVTLRQLEAHTQNGLTHEQQDKIAEALWDIALQIEEGDLGNALERLHRAQDRLSEAMRNGASDQEIAELMQELRKATQDYLNQLARQARENGDFDQNNQQMSENFLEMSQTDLQAMMDRIQELMEQGRMAEAQQALEELQRMMENMRVTQGQGKNSQSPEGQALEGLAKTLRQQQGLSDQAFRNLQQQFNSDSPQSQGQGEQRQGNNERPDGNGSATQDQRQDTELGERGLADRQNALRNQLGQQKGQLPGTGTTENDDARNALNRAENAMEGAEKSLRNDDIAEAIDQQSEAMEALREAMRSLGEMLSRQQQGQPGQGTEGANLQDLNRDPLGRNFGSNGNIGTNENLLFDDNIRHRAQELLDEIRRRSGESQRPDIELDYLKRLLERF